MSPAYEGWEVGADGTKYFVFGYMNRNWQEEIDVPIGPENSFNIGNPDQGQPTHFLPRRNRFMFRVPVPKGFSDTDELVWTLTTHGKTEKAYASLRLDYQIDDVVRASETGALGAGSSSPEIRSNRPPSIEIQGRKSLTAKVGEPVTLTAVVADDGIPKRRGIGARRRGGQQRWLASDHARHARQPRDAAAGARHRRQERRPARVVVRVSRQRQRRRFRPNRSCRGKTHASARTHRGRRCGCHRHCRRTEEPRYRSRLPSPASTCCDRALTMARSPRMVK